MTVCKHCEEGWICVGEREYLDEYGNPTGEKEFMWSGCSCCGGENWENCPNCRVTTMSFGKYKGKNLKWIALNDSDYIFWLQKKNIIEIPKEIYDLAIKYREVKYQGHNE